MDGGQVVFKMGLLPWRRGHSSLQGAKVTWMEGRLFSKWGSRLGAADIPFKRLHQLRGWRAARFQNGVLALALRTFVFKSLQRLHGCRAGGFQHGALALAPRTFVLTVCVSYTDGGRLVFKKGLSLSEGISYQQI